MWCLLSSTINRQIWGDFLPIASKTGAIIVGEVADRFETGSEVLHTEDFSDLPVGSDVDNNRCISTPNPRSEVRTRV
jgi:hypothetical protein